MKLELDEQQEDEGELASWRVTPAGASRVRASRTLILTTLG